MLAPLADAAAADPRPVRWDVDAWYRPAHHAAYDTGIVYPSLVRFPADETSAYTGAAVILAADAISGSSAASNVFVPRADT